MTNNEIIEVKFYNQKQCKKLFIKLLKDLHKTQYKSGLKEVKRWKRKPTTK